MKPTVVQMPRRQFLIGATGAAIAVGVQPSFALAGDPYAAPREAARAAVAAKTVQSLSVAVFRNGRIDWEESFGWADREAGIVATPRTSYSLASISKSFTATALMTLVASGKVDLDKPINSYLGAAKVRADVGDANDATVRRVANHTSGLPFHAQFFYDDGPDRLPPEATTIRKWARIMSRPGERYAYCNLGYGLLGDVIAHSANAEFGEQLRRSVLAPLGLNDSFMGAPWRRGVQLAARYTTEGKRLPGYVTDHAGASEVYSSAHDLIRFAAFHLKLGLPGQRAILDHALIDAMHVNTSSPGEAGGYGIGFSSQRRRGYDAVSHGGAMPGVATQMMLFPSLGVAIVVLANTWSSPTVGKIFDSIASAILPDWAEPPSAPPAAKPADTIPPELAGTWAGTISREEGDLAASISVGPTGEVMARLGSGPPVVVKDVTFAKNRVGGIIPVPLDAKETRRYPNTTRFDLKHEGERLFGLSVAMDNMTSQTFVAGLAYWTSLQKVAAAS